MLDRLEVDIEKVESTIGDKLHMLDKDKDGVLSTGELSEVHRTTTQQFVFPASYPQLHATPSTHGPSRICLHSMCLDHPDHHTHPVCQTFCDQVILHVLKRHTSEEEALKIAATFDKDADGILTVQVRPTDTKTIRTHHMEWRLVIEIIVNAAKDAKH